ncbi:MAG: hypothetical protein ACD_75C00690G0001 [uncultured bacterium]|nr:MAG: hypothetical protein ACD_75C00690G0001 [uncultured bacterium]
MQGVGIGTLAGKIETFKAGNVILFDKLALGILFFDGPEGSRSREQRLHLMLGNDAPEGAGIGSSDGLSFIENRGGTLQQRGINDIGMTDNPADVGSRPPDFTGIDVIQVLHGPVQGNCVAAVVPYNTFRHSGRPGGVEDVQRVGRIDFRAANRLAFTDQFLPVDVATGNHVGFHYFALKDDDFFHFMSRLLNGAVDQRFIGKDLLAFDGPGGSDQ